jgi:hypothetical protein
MAWGDIREPSTIDGWVQLARQHELAAGSLIAKRDTRQQAIYHAGSALECLLKALIMKEERFNLWPSRSARNDLYIHDLRKLLQFAKIDLTPTSPSAAEWSIVLQWDRWQGYDPTEMPRRVARSYLDAAFGQTGVAKWLMTQLR